MDDGLILNLDVVHDAPSKVAQGKKGGRWTDRLKAKRVAKRKTRPEAPAPSKSDATVSVSDVRPAKRPRKEREREEHDQERAGLAAAPAGRHPTQVISSLFTSNPKIEKPQPQSASNTHAKPSNAPLDSSTFTGSGLDPLIVAHLSSKMNISRPTSIQRAVLPAILPTLEDPAARDVFIQSQTGSGKTLSFLLPIIQDLLPLSSHSYIDRSIGTLAIIIAPTRELAKQISDVLEALLKLRLRAQDESAEESSVPRLTRWLVSGLLTGGENRTHEKARLRKGVPILVSTPGRLLDHLQNTSSFNVGKCRWLVLDEADRLMELGFEETIQGILKGLDGRRKLAVQATEEGKSMDVGGWDWSRRRRTILCSATIREDVQKLAGQTLTNPMMIRAVHADDPPLDPQADPLAEASAQKFTPPSQLSQKYVVVPLKLRLVTLVALLRSLLAQSQSRKGTKIIVFLSCTDSVDFHWRLLGGTAMDEDEGASSSASEAEESDEEESDKDLGSETEGPKPPKRQKKTASGEKIEVKSALLPDTSLYRLHGSLPLQTRLASLKGFSAVPTAKSPNTSASSILLCTSVASRGLDLPLVRAVIQYDLPTESGATEYVHRVGRTARAGKGGEAWSFVAPSETEWVKWVQARMQGEVKGADKKDGEGSMALEGVSMETVLRKGFGGKGSEYEERATEVQLSFERWVLRDKQNAEAARRAFLSHMRAYATHPSDEKHMFHIRHLHLGHLAKAFALREAPTALGSNKGSKSKSKPKSAAKGASSDRKSRKHIRNPDDSDNEHNVADAEKRMEKVVRAQGRLTKKSGKIVSSGTDEFQLAGGYDLEKIVGVRT
ncbi:DEAD-domain-containing protein [Dichomitus squalens LYAD-421 SS1]|uniref:DEAD-domain-containing protein n=1 Tax=Dichomitus squalens (strain LYAD-421) TaxID=732165 RepID=UPI00044117E3|nr:DEAD-domain-containing protein [Dichomitus squalens LYAD-421 SS1]EJF65354.1 DEAD-domain-containing protein [Dichomitus squalens LYAD-421 SS1]